MFTDKLYIKSFGCKSNYAELFNSIIDLDSLRFDVISIKKLSEIKAPTSNDILVINTCVVTETAEKECIKFIQKALKKHTNLNVLVTGCLINSFKLKNQLEQIKLERLQILEPWQILEKIKSTAVSKISEERLSVVRPGFLAHTRGFLKIQDGCRCYCNYCIVPYVRPWLSLDYSVILSRFKTMLEAGYKEIVLTGINIGNYGKAPGAGKDIDFYQLLTELLELSTNIARIRISSIEPEDVNDRFLRLFDIYSNLCPHLHLPLQSGSNKVLQDMNRKYCREQYIEIVKRFRTKAERVVSADLLIGYPTETEDDFELTITLMKELNLERVHIFTYSPRPHTPASNLPTLPPIVLKQRKARIFAEANAVTNTSWSRFIGSTVQVLSEEQQNDYVAGLGAGYQLVKLPPKTKIGELFNVCLESLSDSWFTGKIID